jgi:hypothetical protein
MIFSTAVTFAEDIGKGKRIIYIPIDNRPINLIQTIEVAERLGYEVLVPPEIFLGTGAGDELLGNPDELWNWLNKNAPNADSAVISTDAMLYGSLVGSRKHQLTPEIILERAKNFERLRKKNPYLPIYAFATIMRTPNYNWEATKAENIPESEYYGKYGAKIFQYTALKDKEETQGISAIEKDEIARIEKEVPARAMKDWFGRRAKNYDANKYFVDLTKSGTLQYFLLGCDDSARYSQTHLESRHLTEYGKPLGKEKLQVMSGADELGMLMLSRAINNDLHLVPSISITYNDGKGGETFPSFRNEKISESLDGAILSVGGIRVNNPENADLVLAVNTFPDGKTLDAGSKKNKSKPHTGIGSYMKMLKGYVKNNYPVGVVDIATSNGSDNALMKRLRNENLQFKIRSYSGWNTATNSAGFLIGAGVLTNYMSNDDIYSLLMTRYFDEWAYQANIRTKINNGLIWTIPGEGNVWGLGTRQEGLEKLTADLLTKFAKENIRLPRGYSLTNIQARYPWNRTFEAEISFDFEEN